MTVPPSGCSRGADRSGIPEGSQGQLELFISIREAVKSVKQGNGSLPKQEVTLDPNSRTPSPAVAHAGDKNCFLLTKETSFLLILFQGGLGRGTGPPTHSFPVLSSLLFFCRGPQPRWRARWESRGGHWFSRDLKICGQGLPPSRV